MSASSRRAGNGRLLVVVASTLLFIPPVIAYSTRNATIVTVSRSPTRIFLASSDSRLFAPSGRGQPVTSILNIQTPLKFGEYRWDEHGVPAGPVWIRVDLKRQIVSIFRAGHEIGTAVVSYGHDSKPTPPGSFKILEKQRDHRSSAYDADMPYALRLTGDWVSIHGGTIIAGTATHGCVGVPTPFAARLFDVASTGDVVVIDA